MLSQDLKEQILAICNERLEKLRKQTFTKNQTERLVEIDGYSGSSVIEALNTASEEHGIPLDKLDIFSVENEGSFEVTEVWIGYDHQVPFSDKEREKKIIEQFNRVNFFNLVYKLMTENGYQRTSINSSFFKEYDGQNSLYHRMLREDYDGVIEYFMCRFKEKSA